MRKEQYLFPHKYEGLRWALAKSPGTWLQPDVGGVISSAAKSGLPDCNWEGGGSSCGVGAAGCDRCLLVVVAYVQRGGLTLVTNLSRFYQEGCGLMFAHGIL